jgi:Trm5-related predicted tRNA methylase
MSQLLRRRFHMAEQLITPGKRGYRNVARSHRWAKKPVSDKRTYQDLAISQQRNLHIVCKESEGSLRRQVLRAGRRSDSKAQVDRTEEYRVLPLGDVSKSG